MIELPNIREHTLGILIHSTHNGKKKARYYVAPGKKKCLPSKVPITKPKWSKLNSYDKSFKILKIKISKI